MKRRAPARAIAVLLVSASSSDAFPRHPVPRDSTDTLMLGWERQFTVEWSAEPAGARAHASPGYVTNHYGGQIDHMRLLAQAIDASGTVVDRRITWVPGGVNGFGRAYFQIGDLTPAPRYGVTVWDDELMQS